ncbi:MAG: DUF6465 family protein [Clostridia bacterium]|nr:DUF6465 family protein [Clostridia bacterium]
MATKKTTAAKAETKVETKTEATTEVKAETKPATKSCAKKTAAKAKAETKPVETKTEVKAETKPVETKTEVKAETKVEVAPVEVKPAEPTVSITLEYQNNKVSMDSVVANIKAAYAAEGKTDEIKSIEVYAQPETKVAYYIINGEINGKVTL